MLLERFPSAVTSGAERVVFGAVTRVHGSVRLLFCGLTVDRHAK